MIATPAQTVAENNATQTVIEHGEPSSLPELDWFWRRLYVFVLTTACCAFIWLRTDGVTDIVTLRMCLKYALWIIMALVFVYITGGSAEKVVQLTAALRSTRREVTTTAPPPATITAEGDVKTGAAAPPARPTTPGVVTIPKSIP